MHAQFESYYNLQGSQTDRIRIPDISVFESYYNLQGSQTSALITICGI